MPPRRAADHEGCYTTIVLFLPKLVFSSYTLGSGRVGDTLLDSAPRLVPIDNLPTILCRFGNATIGPLFIELCADWTTPILHGSIYSCIRFDLSIPNFRFDFFSLQTTHIYLYKILFSYGLGLLTTRCHLGQDFYLWLDGFGIAALSKAKGFTN